MDAYSIVCADTVDGLNFRTAVQLHLVVGAAGKDLTLDVGTLKRSAGDGNHGAGALAGITHAEGLAKRNVEAYYIFQFGTFGFTALGHSLCPSAQRCERTEYNEEKVFHDNLLYYNYFHKTPAALLQQGIRVSINGVIS